MTSFSISVQVEFCFSHPSLIQVWSMRGKEANTMWQIYGKSNRQFFALALICSLPISLYIYSLSFTRTRTHTLTHSQLFSVVDFACHGQNLATIVAHFPYYFYFFYFILFSFCTSTLNFQLNDYEAFECFLENMLVWHGVWAHTASGLSECGITLWSPNWVRSNFCFLLLFIQTLALFLDKDARIIVRIFYRCSGTFLHALRNMNLGNSLPSVYLRHM